jgi:hypothetical protein
MIFDHPPPYGGGNTQAADWDRTIRVGGDRKARSKGKHRAFSADSSAVLMVAQLIEPALKRVHGPVYVVRAPDGG